MDSKIVEWVDKIEICQIWVQSYTTVTKFFTCHFIDPEGYKVNGHQMFHHVLEKFQTLEFQMSKLEHFELEFGVFQNVPCGTRLSRNYKSPNLRKLIAQLFIQMILD